MSAPDHPLELYTDGGANPNPGPGGWAVVIVDPRTGQTRELSGSEPATTNNRMELTAAIRALEQLAPGARAQLHTDSNYVRLGMTEWLPRWSAQGFRRREGKQLKPVQNEDLWRRLAALDAARHVDWRWLKGHAGHQHNERADRLAAAEIEKIGGGRSTGALVADPGDATIHLQVKARGGRGTWAALVRRAGTEQTEHPEEAEQTLRGSAAPTTANRLELLAASAALAGLPANQNAVVFTASDYLRSGAERGLRVWPGRRWRTEAGGEVKNQDLWRALARVLQGRRVRWAAPAADAQEPEALERLLRTPADDSAG